MKITLALFFYSLILDNFADEKCPVQCPATNLPTVENGKIILTVFYDNDSYSSAAKPNTDLVKIVCDAMDAFGDELEAHFKVGAGSERPGPYENSLLYCLNDCEQDCKDACAAKFIGFFPTQVCCNKRGRDFYQCAADQGLQEPAIDTCLDDHKVCREVLIGNSDLRKATDIPDCQLPIVLYNGKTDRCSKFKNSAEFIQILCGIFKRGNLSPKPCQSSP